MNILSTEAKQAIVEKVLAKDGRTMGEIAKAHNIGHSTLSKWVRKYRDYGIINKQISKNNNQVVSTSDQFIHLLATAASSTTASTKPAATASTAASTAAPTNTTPVATTTTQPAQKPSTTAQKKDSNPTATPASAPAGPATTASTKPAATSSTTASTATPTHTTPFPTTTAQAAENGFHPNRFFENEKSPEYQTPQDYLKKNLAKTLPQKYPLYQDTQTVLTQLLNDFGPLLSPDGWITIGFTDSGAPINLGISEETGKPAIADADYQIEKMDNEKLRVIHKYTKKDCFEDINITYHEVCHDLAQYLTNKEGSFRQSVMTLFLTRCCRKWREDEAVVLVNDKSHRVNFIQNDASSISIYLDDVPRFEVNAPSRNSQMLTVNCFNENGQKTQSATESQQSSLQTCCELFEDWAILSASLSTTVEAVLALGQALIDRQHPQPRP